MHQLGYMEVLKMSDWLWLKYLTAAGLLEKPEWRQWGPNSAKHAGLCVTGDLALQRDKSKAAESSQTHGNPLGTANAAFSSLRSAPRTAPGCSPQRYRSIPGDNLGCHRPQGEGRE